MARVADSKSPVQITELLQAWGRGDRTAFDQLATVVCAELRRLARHYMASERPDHTLQPTALVHEAYIRLADFRSLHWKNRIQFFAISAQVMRRVLVDSPSPLGDTHACPSTATGAAIAIVSSLVVTIATSCGITPYGLAPFSFHSMA